MVDFESKVHAKLGELDAGNRRLTESLSEFIRLPLQMTAPYHRFVRVFSAQIFLHPDEFVSPMSAMDQLTRSTTEALFLALRKRRAIRADVDISDLTFVFKSLHLGLSVLWAIEGPPFRATDYVLQHEIALFCEGLEPRKQ
jgi:hypothetical protein